MAIEPASDNAVVSEMCASGRDKSGHDTTPTTAPQAPLFNANGVVSRLLVQPPRVPEDIGPVDIFRPFSRFDLLNADGDGVFSAPHTRHDGFRYFIGDPGFLLL